MDESSRLQKQLSKKKRFTRVCFCSIFSVFFPENNKHTIYAASESLKAFCKLGLTEPSDLVGGLSYERALHSAGMCNTGIEKHSNCS